MDVPSGQTHTHPLHNNLRQRFPDWNVPAIFLSRTHVNSWLANWQNYPKCRTSGARLPALWGTRPANLPIAGNCLIRIHGLARGDGCLCHHVLLGEVQIWAWSKAHLIHHCLLQGKSSWVMSLASASPLKTREVDWGKAKDWYLQSDGQVTSAEQTTI